MMLDALVGQVQYSIYIRTYNKQVPKHEMCDESNSLYSRYYADVTRKPVIILQSVFKHKYPESKKYINVLFTVCVYKVICCRVTGCDYNFKFVIIQFLIQLKPAQYFVVPVLKFKLYFNGIFENYVDIIMQDSNFQHMTKIPHFLRVEKRLHLVCYPSRMFMINIGKLFDKDWSLTRKTKILD